MLYISAMGFHLLLSVYIYIYIYSYFSLFPIFLLFSIFQKTHIDSSHIQNLWSIKSSKNLASVAFGGMQSFLNKCLSIPQCRFFYMPVYTTHSIAQSQPHAPDRQKRPGYTELHVSYVAWSFFYILYV